MTQAPLALPYQPRGPVVQQGLGYPQMQAPIQPYSPYANWNTPTTTPVQPQAYQPPAYQASMPLAPAPYVHMQMMNQRMGLTTRPPF